MKTFANKNPRSLEQAVSFAQQARKDGQTASIVGGGSDLLGMVKEFIVKPDVLVKGEDYAKEQVVGWDLVESCGGRVALAPLVDGRSTSAVIQKILEAYK